MASHPIDFDVFGGPVAAPQLKDLFSEKKRIQRWLHIEATLAEVQAELNIIPHPAAREISSKARLDFIDLDKVREAYLKARHSLVPLLRVFKQACSNESGQYIHYGATTQDILDTAEILEIKDAMEIIYGDLRALEKTLLDLALKHATTPIIGRTHGQQALPTTFGFKVAVWASEIRRHIIRLVELSPRLFVGQLSGGVGTFSALGPQGPLLSEMVFTRLGLLSPEISWHNSRDNVCEAVSFLTLLTGTLGKIANEIFQLQKTEISELAEPADTSIGSSTMPHKTNPVRCQRIVALSRQIRHLSGLVHESSCHEHERDVRCLNAEWGTVPTIFIYSGTALKHMLTVLSGLHVNTSRMLNNLHLQSEMILTEWLLFRLAPHMGKMRAHEKLHALAATAARQNNNLSHVIKSDNELKHLLSDEDFSFLKHPECYLGQAPEIVSTVTSRIQKAREKDPQILYRPELNKPNLGAL